MAYHRRRRQVGQQQAGEITLLGADVPVQTALRCGAFEVPVRLVFDAGVQIELAAVELVLEPDAARRQGFELAAGADAAGAWDFPLAADRAPLLGVAGEVRVFARIADAPWNSAVRWPMVANASR